MTVMLTIETKTEWLGIIWELNKKGLIEGIDYEDIAIPEDRFPIRFPLNLDCLMDLADKPFVKPFKKKIQESLKKNIMLTKKGLC